MNNQNLIDNNFNKIKNTSTNCDESYSHFICAQENKIFVFEILSENLPFHIQKNLITQWQDIINIYFKNCIYKIYATPMRMAIKIENIESISKYQTIKGPATMVPHNIIERFLQKYGLQTSDIKNDSVKNESLIYYTKEKLNNKEFYFIKKKIRIEETLKDFCNDILEKSTGPNKMKWGNYNIEWFRPIHNILCMLNDKVINFKFGHLHTNNKTYQYSNSFIKKEYILESANNYENLELNVILDYDQRKEYIKNEISKYTTIHDASLLDEVTGISENPVIIQGQFDKKYLELPQEIIINILKEHQRYFAVFHNSQLLNSFLFISNKSFQDTSLIIKGNETVLKARLEDAVFFWQQDLQQNIKDYEDMLSKRIFLEKLGSVLNRISRMKNIVQNIFNKNTLSKISMDVLTNSSIQIDLLEALTVSKIDLCMSIVEEHPSLQGIIGAKFLQKKGYKSEICKMVKNQYLYKINYDYKNNYFINQQVSNNNNDFDNQEEVHTLSKPSQYMCFIENFEKFLLLSMIGIKAKGIKDPFGLKRSLNVIIYLAIINQFDLRAMIKIAYDLMQSNIDTQETYQNIISLIDDKFNSIAINIVEQNHSNHNIENNKLISPVDFSLFNESSFYDFVTFIVNFYQNIDQVQLEQTMKRISGIKMKTQSLDVFFDNITDDKPDQLGVLEHKMYNQLWELHESSKANHLAIIGFIKNTLDDLNEFFDKNKIVELDTNSAKYNIFVTVCSIFISHRQS